MTMVFLFILLPIYINISLENCTSSIKCFLHTESCKWRH